METYLYKVDIINSQAILHIMCPVVLLLNVYMEIKSQLYNIQYRWTIMTLETTTWE